MTWTLLIILLVGGHATISTDMKFVDQTSCNAVRREIERDVRTWAGSGNSVFFQCYQTPGRQ